MKKKEKLDIQDPIRAIVKDVVLSESIGSQPVGYWKNT